jgi:tRNA(His) guanylyltransferase
MKDPLHEHFQSFALLDDDSPMRGFRRVVRCALKNWQALADHPAFGFERPFDPRFAKSMVKAVTHVVGTDGNLLFAYAEHGEFSVLFSSAGDDGQGNGRALLCQLASQAAGRLSLLLGDLVTFDVHLYQFPSPELAKAYFLWRQTCQRSAFIDRYVLHLLRQNDKTEAEASSILEDFGDEEKREILAQSAVDLDALPQWQLRGTGVYWQGGLDEEEPSLMVDTLLPAGREFGEYLRMFF